MNASASPSTHYSRLARLLHWGTLLLMIAAYATAELRGLAPDRSARIAVMQWHMALGLLIWLLVLPRIGARLVQPVPAIVPAPGRFVHLAARAAHLLLYLFLIVQPLLGLLTAQAGDRAVTIPLLGFTLPNVVGLDSGLHEWTEDLHVALGKAFYVVIGLHAVAALAHHLYFRDNTLRRMLG
ncbi:cytochrome b [Tahibacter caeni]|uniref:cytochrome b n=1 Tax=Tahibacter caeni TaxID=1453545 RepID=UPI0021480232|nr:cytochrome b/b6 domain-containing protein [Tahibacter caeni]